MDILTFVILSLATWRVSKLLVSESGPFNVFLRLRKWFGIIYDSDGEVWMIPDRFFPQLFSCTWCTSVWISFLWFIAWYLAPEETKLLAIPFAMSAVAILFESHILQK